MVQINRLRLSGFKSFVDKTELDIGGGLNGIVGPNGCGKSNLVEALRWVMGENRAKNMRGGEMEDVIFAGTSARPARSIAEVSVLLDNTDGKAPMPFGAHAQIEVTRRIERDKGSQYLVNGKVVRARDVQLLFADALTGSHSPALVSQGRVAQIIQAKPEDRRKMLEESAGVASLYTRRHEAELRLKAADENLVRLDLVLGELTSRGNSLRNQAKQAVRYRDLSDTIRRFESLLAWQEWGATRERLRKEEARFAETDAAVRDVLAKTSSLTAETTYAAEAVEELRRTDTESRAALQLLRQTSEQLAREASHRRNEFNDINRQLEQAEADMALAQEQATALRERSAIITADLARLDAEEEGKPTEQAGLEAELATAQSDVRDAENNVLTLQDRIRRMQSERAAAMAERDRAARDANRLAEQLTHIEEQHASAHAPDSAESELSELQAQLQGFKDQRMAADEAVSTAQETIEAARLALTAARDTLAAASQEKDLKGREIKSLNQLLNKLSEGFEKSLILSLDIPVDLARAVAAAAGDAALRAGHDDWAMHGEGFADHDWPAGVTPLHTLIDAPANLSAFVSSVGIVDSGAGAALAATLKRGQVLVTREGQVWRWDGLAVPEAADANAESQILALRAQIRDAEAALSALEPAVAEAETTAREFSVRRDALAAELSAAQQAAKAATTQLYAAEERANRLQKTVNDRAMRRQLLDEQLKAAQENSANAKTALDTAQLAANALDDSAAADTLNAELATGETALREKRAARDTLSSRIEAVKAATAQVKHLRDSLIAEGSRTTDQIVRQDHHAAQLAKRTGELTQRRDTMAPQIAADDAGTAQHDLLDRIATAEEAVRNASDAFTEADTRARSLAAELRRQEEEGSAQREKRAVIQATVVALQGEQNRIATEIEERFSSSPAALENAVMVEWPEGLPSQSKAKSERDFLMRERDAMGAVNLRAEIELNETESEHSRLEAEKIDLAAAIARLREGIGMLNGEARERIVKTFGDVNTHFQHLFKRLFGGGDAYLKLEGAEDPLDCGLEIYAQPPGKTLQNLNLLSGGEQTLTALAMIFAMFLSNPAPVCVLDEVDAPLDDANVDRVCSLLEEMSASCATRFLVITHHRMTMARMDRLYGVTMAERGVSQLVSVNLATQGDFLEKHIAA